MAQGIRSRLPFETMTTSEHPELTFFCEGTPAPGGSKTAFALRRGDGSLVLRPGGSPVINVTDAGGAANKTWKKVVAWAGRDFMGSARPFEGALKVEFVFFLRRPKAHYRTGQFAHLLRDDAPRYHTQKPDALKFCRSTEDGLTGICWVDDSQTVRVCSEKRWANAEEKAGCAVRIVVLSSPPV
jgi:Holliday junction resolvase RusA-like endonuclease